MTVNEWIIEESSTKHKRLFVKGLSDRGNTIAILSKIGKIFHFWIVSILLVNEYSTEAKCGYSVREIQHTAKDRDLARGIIRLPQGAQRLISRQSKVDPLVHPVRNLQSNQEQRSPCRIYNWIENVGCKARSCRGRGKKQQERKVSQLGLCGVGVGNVMDFNSVWKSGIDSSIESMPVEISRTESIWADLNWIDPNLTKPNQTET